MRIITGCHDNFLFESFNVILNKPHQPDNFPMIEINKVPTSISISIFVLNFDKLKKSHLPAGIYKLLLNQLYKRMCTILAILTPRVSALP